jgi:hypothetical protein
MEREIVADAAAGLREREAADCGGDPVACSLPVAASCSGRLGSGVLASGQICEARMFTVPCLQISRRAQYKFR